MNKLYFFFILCCIALRPEAQTNVSSSEIYLGLKKLNVLGSVLYIAAHPDDENTRLLTYFSKEKLYRTGYLSITRGDGGQNLIGDEQGIELGLIRTQELLSARRIDGAEQYFTRAFDFGYSKTPEETFAIWNKDKILADVVWVIRKFQPEIIITRFPLTGEGGHGHHTASAILAKEAFIAAADPSRFPEQLKFVQPWQAKRVLWNSFNFNNAKPPADAVSLDVGGYNALLGKSYGEIAAESRSQHKSQGFGATRSRGEALEHFTHIAGEPVQNDILENISTGWSRVKGAAGIEKLVNKIIGSFDFLNPQRSVPQLVQLYKELETLPAGYWKDQKLKETKSLIEQASGLWIDVFTNQSSVVHGDSLKFNVVVNNRLGVNAALKEVSIEKFDTSLNQTLERNRNLGLSKTIFVPSSTPISQPYWLRQPKEEGYYNVDDLQYLGAPEINDSYIAHVDVEFDKKVIRFTKPLKYKYTDPVRGELYQPLAILPALVVTPDQELKLSKGDNKFKGELLVTSKRKNVSAAISNISPKAKSDVKVAYDPTAVKFVGPNQTETIRYEVEADKDNEYSFHLESGKEQVYENSLHQIRHDHIPTITYFTPVSVKNRKLDIQVYGKKIGYIIGAGDKVPEALEQMGYEVIILGEKELSRNNLQQFDAIISGVRAYNTNDWLNKYHGKLMDYVKEGGNLIVQYNTSNNIGPVRAKIGPYTFNISRNRITDEKATVSFLQPAHPVLNFPNKISQEDFKGWVQERSIYHASALDSNFQSILRMNDPGENPDDGSLVIAKYGSGYFTYTGLALFRQLPAGVPGAFRLVANLVALNRKKDF